MSLKDIMALNTSNANQKIGMSEERVAAQMDEFRNLISFFRMYPDLFVDFIKGEDSKFKFYPYQRQFLRACMRYKQVYAVYTRGTGKSFLSMMSLMLKAILYPGCELAVSTGGKEQAASITASKIDQICNMLPALASEINWERGQTRHSKNEVIYKFKNGSKIDILTASEKSRGQRRHGLLIEESILMPGDILNEVLIPTCNISRILPDGTKDEDEIPNQSITYITTAGFKNSFAYEKLVEILTKAVLKPNQFFILGGTYRIPVAEGLMSPNIIKDLKMSDTFSEESFGREYMSIWAGDVENAFYNSAQFEKHRVLLQPEKEYSKRKGANAYYVLGVDVGRHDCLTEIMVFKVTPQANGSFIKSLVNIYSYDAEHFEQQAIRIKKLYYKYRARVVAIDANGLGTGLVDMLTIKQIDPETGDVLPDFGVLNDDDGKYKKQRTADTELNALYLIKANAKINTECYVYAKTQMAGGKIKFLIDENTAKEKLLGTKVGQNMTHDQRVDYLKPFVQTTNLAMQMMNLIETHEGIEIKLDRASTAILKDKFSAFIYGLYYIKQEEDKKKKRKGSGLGSFVFMN